MTVTAQRHGIIDLMLRRMGRWLRTLLAGLMVLLWIAVIALWIRSHWRGDRLVFESRDEIPQPEPLRALQHVRQHIPLSGDGGICVATREMTGTSTPVAPSHWQASKDPSYPQPWGSLARSLTISSRGTLVLNRINSGVKITSFPTTNTFSITIAPATAPSTSTTGLGTL